MFDDPSMSTATVVLSTAAVVCWPHPASHHTMTRIMCQRPTTMGSSLWQMAPRVKVKVGVAVPPTTKLAR